MTCFESRHENMSSPIDEKENMENGCHKVKHLKESRIVTALRGIIASLLGIYSHTVNKLFQQNRAICMLCTACNPLKISRSNYGREKPG